MKLIIDRVELKLRRVLKLAGFTNENRRRLTSVNNEVVPDSESTFHYNWLYLKILIEFDFIYTLFCTLGPFGGFC